MIGLGWRPKAIGESITIDAEEKIVRIPAGQGANPGHPKELDFQIHMLNREHPITAGFPKVWLHPHEQITHGPAKNMTILTYAFPGIKDDSPRRHGEHGEEHILPRINADVTDKFKCHFLIRIIRVDPRLTLDFVFSVLSVSPW
jgi:hypothetical protein